MVAAAVLKGNLACRILRNDIPVKINQVRCAFYAVRVVAGSTGALVVHNMLSVFGKAPVGQDTVTVMTFITERISAKTFRLIIRQAQVPLQ